MEQSFAEWYKEVKQKLTAAGLEIPEEELCDLGQMEGLSVDEFVEQCKREQS